LSCFWISCESFYCERVEGLEDIVQGAEAHRLDHLGFLVEDGEHDHGARETPVPYLRNELEAALSGHRNVRDDQRRNFVLDGHHRGGRIAGAGDPELLNLKKRTHKVSKVLFVFDDKNFRPFHKISLGNRSTGT
jgi:hypothetical protein